MNLCSQNIFFASSCRHINSCLTKRFVFSNPMFHVNPNPINIISVNALSHSHSSAITIYNSLKNKRINVGEADRIITQNPGQGVSSEFRQLPNKFDLFHYFPARFCSSNVFIVIFDFLLFLITISKHSEWISDVCVFAVESLLPSYF